MKASEFQTAAKRLSGMGVTMRQIQAAMRMTHSTNPKAAEAVETAFRDLARARQELALSLERTWRQWEVRRAGQWARGYVMGAMDPTLDEAERDRLVRDLARQGRPDLAVAVIHGWVTNR